VTTSTEYLPGHAADWALVTAAQTGDKDAYGRLYDRHVDAVFRFIWSRIKHKQLTEDLTSETFLRALRRIDSVSYQGRGVCAWFITIAGNLIKDHIKCDTTRKVIPTEIREYDDFGQIYGVCVPLPRSPERIAVGNAAAAELQIGRASCRERV